MSIILEGAPRRRHPSAAAPRIREVCLVGVASRRYRHVELEEGSRAQDPGPSGGARVAAGAPNSGAG